jgi:hypothetical protein
VNRMKTFNGYPTTVMFRVPNNEDGKLFWDNIRKYLNRSTYRLERYGRCKNRRQITTSSHPKLSQSEWYSVYITQKEM